MLKAGALGAAGPLALPSSPAAGPLALPPSPAGPLALPPTAPAGPAPTVDPVDPVDPADLERRALGLRPPAFLLETAVPPHFSPDPGSALRISDRAAVCGSHSLRWDHAARSRVTIRAGLGYTADPYRPLDDQAWQGTVDAFSVWVFNEAAVDDAIRFEFGRGEHVDAWFDFRLTFTGWRTAWVRYGYDLHGRPRPDMDTVRITAPRRSGTLHLDQLLLNTPVRPDGPTRDAQVPEVCREGDVWDAQHWQALLLFDQLLTRRQLPVPEPSPAQRADLRALLTRYHDDYLAAPEPLTVDDAYVAALTEQVEALGVPERTATGTGRPVHSYQAQIHPPEIAADLRAFVAATPLRACTDQMRRVARAHDAAGPAHRPALAALYVRMVAHLRDQGWTHGSCQGTTHHLGYDIGGYYDSVHLMRDALREAGLLDAVRADVAWLSGLGRIFRGWDHRMAHGSIMDILGTTFRGLLAAVLLYETEAEQVAYLRALRDWLDTALLPTPGIQDGIKTDGTVFHHLGCYPDYARDGLAGLAPLVYVMSGGAFRISTRSHAWLKRALLTMRVYANKHQWPVSLSGRHPRGTTALSVTPYEWLACAGTPDGPGEVDRELAAAFLRLLPAEPTARQRALAARLAALGIAAEPDPNGTWALNHAALAVHRREDWQVTVRGHNRYLWSTEVYEGANRYGRYNTYGQIQVLHRGDPVTNADSGYRQPGWDWNRRPGTTTIRKPLPELRADLTGTIEEMPLTDERFAGAHTIDGLGGMFAMRLHEHPKYEGTHRARVSAFLFEDRIVALGTGIGNRDAAHDTETTLFQTALPTRSAPTYVNDAAAPVTRFPYERPDFAVAEPLWLVDDKGLGYYVPAGQRLGFQRTAQASRDNASDLPTTGDFATAWLRHGRAPRGARYEYAMVVRTTPARMAEFTARMRDPERAPYRVLGADETAHVVHDRGTGITGYAFFEPTRRARKAVGDEAVAILGVDTPSMVLTHEDGDRLTLSVCDPDLRLYEGEDRDQYEHGRYVGHFSPWSRPWLNNPSRPHTLRVTLRGRWRPAGREEPCAVVPGGRDDETTVAFETAEGRPVQARLARKAR
ncbi:chondroitinase family polysaccharide lyase [Streptomyces pathocidini]|uniref:chondroitinase family polysaccharide lyase n=1 Tax=Streptomyces pathocidini TaxID=1650571 RepID=UPI0033D3404B